MRAAACVYCEGSRARSDVLIREHVIPRSRGGDDTAENTAVACLACNSAKSDMTPMEWFMIREGVWERDTKGDRLAFRLSRTVVTAARPAVLYLEAHRKAAGMNRAQLAREAGVSRTTVYRLELGEVNGVDFGVLGKLADTLGVAPADLFRLPPKRPK